MNKVVDLKGLHTECPFCRASLVGDEIPEEKRHLYGGATHFGRVIGIYNEERDCIVMWKCPDCNTSWFRNKSLNVAGTRTGRVSCSSPNLKG